MEPQSSSYAQFNSYGATTRIKKRRKNRRNSHPQLGPCVAYFSPRTHVPVAAHPTRCVAAPWPFRVATLPVDLGYI
jgi:hypothetical protein